MFKNKIIMFFSILKVNSFSGILWLLEISFGLLRANIKFLFFLKKPKLIYIGRNVSFKGIRNLNIGEYARINDFCRITAYKDGYLKIGKNFSLGEFSIIENGFNITSQKGEIIIGDNVGLGAYCFISCPSKIEIGNDCIVGQYLSVHAQNHTFDKVGLIRNQGTTEKGILIGQNCWIGSKVTILDGVLIGNSSVIAAGSVVTKSFPENSVIGGNPAKLIKRIL